MRCRIADLLVEVPEAGGMAPRCGNYLSNECGSADVVICADQYEPERHPVLDPAQIAYMESGRLFCRALLDHNGLYLHASAIALNGKAYLFSGPSGMGKSTHTRLWQEVFPNAVVFNDDKPALRYLDGRWYAYGTPWCGKDGINVNMKVPLAGICFLQRGQENVISRLSALEASTRIISQTMHSFYHADRLDLMLFHVDRLVRDIPVFELFNLPEPAAARLSHDTMHRAAEEIGL